MRPWSYLRNKRTASNEQLPSKALVPAEILGKPTKLTSYKFKMIKQNPQAD